MSILDKKYNHEVAMLKLADQCKKDIAQILKKYKVDLFRDDLLQITLDNYAKALHALKMVRGE